MTEAIALSVIIGLLRGGRFVEIARLPVKLITLVFLALIIRYGTEYFAAHGQSFLLKYNLYIHLLFYLLLLIFVFANRKLYGLKITGLGIALNMAVIGANKGYMPVWTKVIPKAKLSLLAAGNSSTHTLLTAHTKLSFLSDIIYIPPPYPLPQLISIGDLLMSVGVFILIQKAMTDINHRSPYKLIQFDRQI